MSTSKPARMIRPSSWVRIVETQDGGALLDIEQGVCFSITPVGALIWQQLKLSKSRQQITEYLASSFPEVAQHQISEDLLQFITALQEKRLLISDSTSSVLRPRIPAVLALLMPGRRPRNNSRAKVGARTPRLLFWKSLIGLALFDALHLERNFSRLHRSILEWPVAICSTSPDAVDRVCQAVNHACGWYPKRVLCLQRSFVTTCLLRNCGVQAELVLGAQKFPFKAHAWTEVSGRPINERRDVQSIYLVWERC
jgi:hypothetical protein